MRSTLAMVSTLALITVSDAWAQNASGTGARRRITVGVVEAGSANRGIVLGTEEAARTASMFGWELEVLRAPDSLSSPGAVSYFESREVTAIVGDLSGIDRDSLSKGHTPVVLDIGTAPRRNGTGCGDGRFYLLPPSPADTPQLTGSPDAKRDEAVVVWHSSLERFGAGQLNDRYRRRFGNEMHDREWAGWMATKILIDAVLKSGTAEPRRLQSYLAKGAGFDGHKGVPLYFNPLTRELVQPVYSTGEAGVPTVSHLYPSGPDATAGFPGDAPAACPLS